MRVLSASPRIVSQESVGGERTGTSFVVSYLLAFLLAQAPPQDAASELQIRTIEADTTGEGKRSQLGKKKK